MKQPHSKLPRYYRSWSSVSRAQGRKGAYGDTLLKCAERARIAIKYARPAQGGLTTRIHLRNGPGLWSVARPPRTGGAEPSQ